MELKEFVAQSIIQIMEGVKEAQRKAIELDGSVNPYTIAGNVKGYSLKDLSNIEFEVSVTSEDKAGIGGGLNVFFGAISVGGKVDVSDSKIALNRLKFTIPVMYPQYSIYEDE
jgi:hypothetical protein